MGKFDDISLALHEYFHSLADPLFLPKVSLKRYENTIEVMVNRTTSTISLRRLSGLIMTLLASLDPEDPHRNLDLADPADFTSQLTVAVQDDCRPFNQASMVGDLHNLDAIDPAERLEFEAIADLDVESLSTYLFLCTISPVQAQRWIADDGRPATPDDAELVTQALRYALHRRRTFVGADDPGTLMAMYEWEVADVTDAAIGEAIANGYELAQEVNVGAGVYRTRRISD